MVHQNKDPKYYLMIESYLNDQDKKKMNIHNFLSGYKQSKKYYICGHTLTNQGWALSNSFYIQTHFRNIYLFLKIHIACPFSGH